MTLIPQTSMVRGLLMLTYMASEFLGIVFPTWRQFTAVVVTMQGFRLGHSAREYFLKLMESVMNDIEHNFVDTIFTKRILQSWAVV